MPNRFSISGLKKKQVFRVETGKSGGNSGKPWDEETSLKKLVLGIFFTLGRFST